MRLIALAIAAINLNVSALDVERALVIARGRDTDRARYHAPYITSFKHPYVQSLEIVTEFRRIVQLAEESFTRGDRRAAYSVTAAQDAAAVWKNRVAVVARLRFHPLNTYVVIPEIAITLDGPNGAAALIGVRKEPLLAMTGAPGEHVPILGAIAEGVFDAALVGQSQRNVTVTLDGKDLLTARLDFAAVE